MGIGFCSTFVSIALVSAFAIRPSAAALVPANDTSIFYEGRTAPGAQGGVRMGFPGVVTRLRFRGTRVSLKAEASTDAVYFDVSLDGADPTLLRFKGGEGTYPVVHDATAGEHSLEITRRTESWQGLCEFRQFDLGSDGVLLPAAPLPLRKLLFIGDSVTCGSMTAWQPGVAMADAIASNARTSYGMMLARKLRAQCHLVSCGGRGVLRDWQAIRDLRAAPQFYELAIPDDLSAPWDPSRYVPDAVGIQLGTNDFSSGIPDETDFVNAYIGLLQKVRRDAPNAFIVLMESPIVNDGAEGPRRTVLHAYLERIVHRMNSDRVVLAPIKHVPGVPNNGHPSYQEHVEMVSELEPLLRRSLGW